MKETPDDLVVSGSFMDRCYIVTIQGELQHETLDRICANIMQTVYDTEVKGAILDLHGVTVFDTEIFAALKKITKMIAVMGVNVVWTGLRPGVASALVDFDVDVHDITVAMNLEQGLEMIKANTIGAGF
jgi:anti-anti-sigma regulatory factor